MKRFIALARVSSREQAREGFSLDVQEDAFREYAKKHGGRLVRLFRIAETATKSEERKEWHSLQFAPRRPSAPPSPGVGHPVAPVGNIQGRERISQVP